MTAAAPVSGRRRSGFEWSVRLAWLLALVAAALQLLGVLITAGAVPGLLAGNPVSTTIGTALPLHPVGQNAYGGAAFIADSAQVTATSVTAEVSDPATSVRVGLAFGPLAWGLTGAGVAIALSVAFGRLTGGRPDARIASRAFTTAAAITAVGTSAAQILDEIARTGLQGVLWHAPRGMGPIGAGADFTFQFGWLAVSVAGLAIGALVARLPDDRELPRSSS